MLNAVECCLKGYGIGLFKPTRAKRILEGEKLSNEIFQTVTLPTCYPSRMPTLVMSSDYYAARHSEATHMKEGEFFTTMDKKGKETPTQRLEWELCMQSFHCAGD